MKTSHKDLISLIDLCRLDEHFKSLVSPMFAWRDWVSIRKINAMYYPLCQLYLGLVARVLNG